ncbi:MAG: hypothetical protein HYR94_21565 [Chloroflexi bacterium]|nr:hypothetical protein [Chloroflexota bacterium]
MGDIRAFCWYDTPHHRHAKLMVMTPKGRKALDYVELHHADWANQIGGQQSLEGLQTAVTILRQLRKSLEQHTPQSPEENV